MTQEEKHLLDRYIDNSLTGIELRDFIDRLESSEEFKKEVSFHNLLIEGIHEAEDKRLTALIEKSLHYKKPFIPLALKLIVTFLFVTLGGIILWNYIDPGSTGKRHNYFTMNIFRNGGQKQKNDSIIELTLNNKTDYRNLQQAVDRIQAIEESAKINDTINESQSNIADIIVKKDQLMMTYNLKPIEINNDFPDSVNKNGPLSSFASQLLDEGGELPDQPDKIEYYTVEFWVSPVNYKGYKLVNDKLILFGIEQPDIVVLYSGNNKLWMRYGNDFFYLEPGEYFESFVQLNEIPYVVK